jgi:hypothetical protein
LVNDADIVLFPTPVRTFDQFQYAADAAAPLAWVPTPPVVMIRHVRNVVRTQRLR